MNGHASINRLYRLVWNQTLGQWVAVAETARGRGKSTGRRRLLAALFAGAASVTGGHALADAPAPAQLPTGGKVVAGTVNLSQSGARLDITQASQRGVVQWDTFNVGQQAQVNFLQPSAAAVTLNRVLDTQASQIFGRITSNGQVFLTNPNGVYFSPTASVDVGGLVATTHGITTDDFMAGRLRFTRDGATGSVVNDGTLNASLGGYIALLAPEVRNRGVVTAQAGTVALAAGDAVELHFSGSRSLAGVVVSKADIDALVDNGGAVHAPGGLIVLSAQAASQLQSSVVRNTGTLEATGLSSSGGRIVLDSTGLVDHSGSADVSGSGVGGNGGSITVQADRMLSAGTLRADGTAQGGSIASTLASSLVETSSAALSATGGGGSIAVDAGAGQVYTSGRYDASGLAAGQRGGSVSITGGTLALMGASADASGHSGGGSVRIGGDLHGANPALGNATTTTIGKGVVLSADATVQGDGGKVVVWADETTTFAGSVSAKGGALAGNGGQLEVSGKGTLHFAGKGDASAVRGQSGTLLLDPKNIFIDDQVTGQVEYIDPHSTAGGTFGALITPLTTTTSATVNTSGTITGTTADTGYVVISNPTDTLGASTGGAVYLFRRSDQALISTLYGTHAGDQVGSNVTTLTNGNFVVGSPQWNSGRGAATWGSGTLGWGNGATAAVSSSNSLVGTLAPFANSQGYTVSDRVGADGQVKPLITGNYLVANSGWGNGVGAVAFGNGASGSSGTIGSGNALIGSTVYTQAPGTYLLYKNGDNIGGGITYLPNGNYVVSSYVWNKGVGAVALGSGSSGISGVVSASNSLIGTTSRSDATGNGNGTDKVGHYLRVLTGSEFVVYTSDWNTGNGVGSAGALTWSNGSTMAVGVLSASNSLVGNQGDYLTSAGLTLLPSNAYVVSSPLWNGSRGAATRIAFGSDPKSIGIATYSVAGGTTGDAIGSRAVTLLANGDYVLSSPGYQSGRGAVTLVDGATGKTKTNQSSVVNAANSLVGSQTTDNVGQHGIVELTGNGNFVALSPNWSNGGTSQVGAVTWSSGSTPTVGAVSSSNSLVGSNANDRVGQVQYTSYSGSTPIDNQYPAVTPLTNGNYVVASPMWNGTRGAVTLGNGASGTAGAVTASNSLLGSNAGDYVGAFASPVAAYAPASQPAYFTLSSGVQGLANGNFVVVSDFWKNGSAAHAGAVTWSSGSSSPTVGTVSSSNSVVGSTAEDLVGWFNGQRGITQLFAGYDSQGRALNTSNYVITSSLWNNGAVADAGAVTWGSGSAGSSGSISSANSVVGNSSGEIAAAQVQPLASGNYLILDSLRDIGAVQRAGALTLLNGSTGRVSDYSANGSQNLISAANSLVGSTTDDMQSANLAPLYTVSQATNGYVNQTGNYVLASYSWDNGSLADAGAVTWGNGSSGVTGTIGRSNSVIGEKAGDYLGYYVALLPTGDYVVGNPTRDIGNVVNAGAASWVSGSTGRLSNYVAAGNQNIVSAANSMVGSHPGDYVGDGVYALADLNGNYDRSGYVIYSTSWNCYAGALTYVADGTVPLIGTVGPSNSAVGDPNGNFVGGLGNYYPVLVPNNTALITFGGGGGHVYESTPAMPTGGGMAIANATQFGDAAGSTQMVTPDYVAGVLRTGTSLTLQASNDILVRGSIDATGGTAGGTLTLDAGRSIAVLGNIVTGNRNLTLVANDTLAAGVVDAQRDAGIATISMGVSPQGQLGTINAGTGGVSITMLAGADKTNHMGGSIGLNSVTAATIKVVNHGDGLGSVGDLPTLANCCGYLFGTQTPGANIALNTGAVLTATGTGTAVTLAADGQFVNGSGQTTGSIVTTDSSARWLVYAAAPGGSSFGGLDSGNTAVWNQAYDPNVAVTAPGNRYVFAYQPSVTVNTQNVTKTYGDDLTSTLAGSVLSLSGAQAGVSGAFLGDTLGSAVTGSATVSSAGAAATAGVAAGPYAINVNLSGISGNNGYAVVLGSNTPRTITVTAKALTASLTGVSKAYDGSTAATLANGNYLLGGLVNGDSFNVTRASGSFNSANVSASSASTTLASGDFTGLAGTLASNYTLPTSASGAATITPKALTASLATQSKAYDGSTAATIGAGQLTLNGFVGAQSASVGAFSGMYNAADVLAASSVSATLAAGNVTAGSGTTLANYLLPTSISGSGSITPKALTAALSGSFTKTYDGTTAVALNASNVALSGVVNGQSVTVANAQGAFNAATVAGASSVAATLNAQDFAAGSGTLLSNYQLPTSANGSGSITRAALLVTATGGSRVYDGTAFSGGNGVGYSGFVNNETSTVLSGSLTYGGSAQGAANAGSYAIVPGGYSAANYTLSYAAGTQAITPKTLTASLATLSKAYDGNTTAAIGAGQLSLNGFVGAQSATVGAFSGIYNAADVLGATGISATLAAGNVTAGSGTTLANYLLPTSISGSGSITPKALTAALSGSFTKTYDGTTAVALNASNVALSGVVNGQSVTVANAQGAFNAATVAGASSVVATLNAQDFAAGSGTLLSNYQLPTSANGSGSITRAALLVTATGGSHVYDGTAFSGGNGVGYSGFVNNETNSVLGGTLAYGGSAQGAANAGSYAILPGGYSAANYAVSYATGTQTITPRQLTAQLVGGLGKVYDATSTATLQGSNVQLAGFVGGQGAHVGALTGTYDGINAGTHTVAATLASGDFTANGGTLLSNYLLPTSASGSAAITPRAVTLTAPSVSKVYDGTTAYAANAGDLVALSAGLLGSDAVSMASLSFGNKNAGAGNRVVNLGGVTINDGNNGGNYSVTLVAGGSGTITPRTLSVSAAASSRVYDSTTAASVSFGDDRIAGDTLAISGNAQFADKNVGSGKQVAVTSLAVIGGDAGNYALASSSTSASASITPATLVVGGVSAVNRSYDASTGVTLAGTPTVTPLGNDVVAVSGPGTGTLADKNAGQNKGVAVAGYTISDPNYVLLQPQGVTVDITPAMLVVAGVSAVNRVYDASTGVTLAGTPTITPLGADVVALSGTGVGTLPSKNAGQNKTVGVAGYTISDPNYMLVQPQGVTVDIAPAQLVITGVGAVDRVYDAGTGVTLSGTPTVAPLGNDVVAVSGAGVGTLADKNAGQHKAVGVGGYTIGDANYVLVQPQGLSVDIAPATLAVGGVTAVSRVYDAGMAVTLAGTATLAPLGGDVVALQGSGSGTLANKNAGLNKTVSVAGYTISDPNYVLLQPQGLTVDIAPAQLLVSGVSAVNRAYDAGTNILLAGTPTVTPLGGDVVTLLGSGGGTLASKNAGLAKAVVVAGYTIGDPNYLLVQPQGLTVDIAPAMLSLAGLSTGAGKTYDGTRTVAIGGTPVLTGLQGEIVNVSGTAIGQTADKNAGIGKVVSVSGLVSGDPNYTVGQQPGLLVDVTPATLRVGGISANDKTFDGSTAASLTGTASVAPLTGDGVVLAGTPQAAFAGSGVGKGQAVRVTGYALSGADRDNYLLAAITLAADINAAPTEAPLLPTPATRLPGQATNSALAMPASGGGLQPAASAAGAGAGVTATTTTATASAPQMAERHVSGTTPGILVSLVRTPSAQQSGEVTVSVPQQIAQDARGFGFALPAGLVESAAAQGTTVLAAGLDGTPLPGWIRYDAPSGSFAVSNPPAGALPLRVRLTIGSQQTTLVVLEQ